METTHQSNDEKSFTFKVEDAKPQKKSTSRPALPSSFSVRELITSSLTTSHTKRTERPKLSCQI